MSVEGDFCPPKLEDVSPARRDIAIVDRRFVESISPELLEVQIDDLPKLELDVNSLPGDSTPALYLKDLSPQALSVAYYILKTWRDAGGVDADRSHNIYYPKLRVGASSFQQTLGLFNHLLRHLSPDESNTICWDFYLKSVCSMGPKPLVEILEALEASLPQE